MKQKTTERKQTSKDYTNKNSTKIERVWSKNSTSSGSSIQCWKDVLPMPFKFTVFS